MEEILKAERDRPFLERPVITITTDEMSNAVNINVQKSLVAIFAIKLMERFMRGTKSPFIRLVQEGDW